MMRVMSVVLFFLLKRLIMKKRILFFILCLIFSSPTYAQVPNEVLKLMGKWERTTHMKWGGGLWYTVEKIYPFTQEMKETCEAAGYFKIQDWEVQRLPDETISWLLDTPPQNIVIFIAKVKVEWSTHEGKGRPFNTVGKILFNEETKKTVLELNYPLGNRGNNSVHLTLRNENELDVISTGIDRNVPFRNVFKMIKIK